MTFRYFCSRCGALLRESDEPLEPYRVGERCPSCGRELSYAPHRVDVTVSSKKFTWCTNCRHSLRVRKPHSVLLYCPITRKYVKWRDGRTCPYYEPMNSGAAAEWGFGFFGTGRLLKEILSSVFPAPPQKPHWEGCVVGG